MLRISWWPNVSCWYFNMDIYAWVWTCDGSPPYSYSTFIYGRAKIWAYANVKTVDRYFTLIVGCLAISIAFWFSSGIHFNMFNLSRHIRKWDCWIKFKKKWKNWACWMVILTHSIWLLHVHFDFQLWHYDKDGHDRTKVNNIQYILTWNKIYLYCHKTPNFWPGYLFCVLFGGLLLLAGSEAFFFTSSLF